MKIHESIRKKSSEEGKIQEKNNAVKKQKIFRKPTITKKIGQQSDLEWWYNCGAKRHQSSIERL